MSEDDGNHGVLPLHPTQPTMTIFFASADLYFFSFSLSDMWTQLGVDEHPEPEPKGRVKGRVGPTLDTKNRGGQLHFLLAAVGRMEGAFVTQGLAGRCLSREE